MSGPDRAEDAEMNERPASRSLGRLVEAEARRVLSEAQLKADPTLLAQGWERRFVVDARRAEELMELYAELGFEVCADPVRPEDVGDDCDDCLLLAGLQLKMIYTRRAP